MATVPRPAPTVAVGRTTATRHATPTAGAAPTRGRSTARAAASPSAAPAAAASDAADCNPLPVDLPAAATLRASTKKVFAYYFPPFPVSVDNAAPASDSYSRWQYSHNSQGGAYDLRDRPIGRNPLSGNWKQTDFETEVRRAIMVGIDGFIFEYHDSGDARWNQLPAMLAAAKAVDPGFRIMLGPDFPLGAGASTDPVVDIVSRYANDPSVYKLDDGRVVLAPFYAERQPATWWQTVQDGLAAKGVPTALVPIFLSWGGGTEHADWDSHVYGYSSWGNRWVSGTATYARDSQAAHARGKIWMQPAAFEDTRAYDGRYWEAGNSGLLRASMQTAIDSDADWVAFITWNDYTESWVSPSAERGHAVLDVASYFIDRFTTGGVPTVARDALYYFHRSQRTDAPFSAKPVGRNGQPVTMAIAAGDPATNNVELLAFLTAPGTLTITQGSTVQTKDASAGMTSFTVPMVAGTTPRFSLSRNASTVASVTSSTPIAASVTYQDMMYHAGGSLTCTRP
ncbi:MAG TPA: glycoside hydrolase family 71 protein [Actinocatenispora sp.]